MSEQLTFVWNNLPHLLIGFPGQRPGGLLMSIWLAVLSLSIGFVVAVFIGAIQQTQRRPLIWLTNGYITVFRGVPILLILLFVHQTIGGRQVGFDLEPRSSAIIALVLYTSAYQAEIIRSGLNTVPESQLAAARLMGLNSAQIFVHVQLTHALRLMRPALVNQIISLFKDTSIVVILGVTELMTTARVVLGSNIANAPYWVAIYLTTGGIYFCVAWALSFIIGRWQIDAHGEFIKAV